MTNWKTTIAGLLAGLGQIFPMVGLSPELGNAVSVVGLFILGIVAKDLNVTGGTKGQ